MLFMPRHEAKGSLTHALVFLENHLTKTHMLMTRSLMVGRRLMCFALCICSFGVHWSLGGYSAAILNWALVAPQLLLFSGNTLREGWVLMGLVTVAFLSSVVAEGLLPDIALTNLPMIWGWAFQFLNLVVPALLSLLLMTFILLRMRQSRRRLERNMKKAEVMAQMIVDFELDRICMLDNNDEDNLIAELLQQVAFNLKLYRPYIPSHVLLSTMCELAGDDSPAVAPASPLSVVDSAGDMGWKNLVESPGAAEDKEHTEEPCRMKLKLCATLRTPAGLFDVVHALRSGTLLYVKLPALEAFAKDGQGPEKVRLAAATFTDVVMAVLKETAGTLHVIQHNCCLLSWNFILRCREHAMNACLAAISLRDRLEACAAQQDMEALMPSMGLWTGCMISGCFGTEEMKFLGALGEGTARAMALQAYGARNGHTIVADDSVRQHVAVVPRVRLLAVDVLASRACSTVQDLLDPSPLLDSELVFEVLESVEVADDEWMYQLQTMEDTSCAQKEVERLLCQAQKGIRDLAAFRNDVQRLREFPHPVVTTVAARLLALTQTAHAMRPYCLRYGQLWAPTMEAEEISMAQRKWSTNLKLATFSLGTQGGQDGIDDAGIDNGGLVDVPFGTGSSMVTMRNERRSSHAINMSLMLQDCMSLPNSVPLGPMEGL